MSLKQPTEGAADEKNNCCRKKGNISLITHNETVWADDLNMINVEWIGSVSQNDWIIELIHSPTSPSPSPSLCQWCVKMVGKMFPLVKALTTHTSHQSWRPGRLAAVAVCGFLVETYYPSERQRITGTWWFCTCWHRKCSKSRTDDKITRFAARYCAAHQHSSDQLLIHTYRWPTLIHTTGESQRMKLLCNLNQI